MTAGGLKRVAPLRCAGGTRPGVGRQLGALAEVLGGRGGLARAELRGCERERERTTLLDRRWLSDRAAQECDRGGGGTAFERSVRRLAEGGGHTRVVRRSGHQQVDGDRVQPRGLVGQQRRRSAVQAVALRGLDVAVDRCAQDGVAEREGPGSGEDAGVGERGRGCVAFVLVVDVGQRGGSGER